MADLEISTLKSEVKPDMPTLSIELNQQLAEELNDKMTSSVLPVTIFVGIETVFGFCGNVLILYVFLFHYHRCNFKYFVLCLSFVDITSTMTTMPGEIVTQTFWYIYPVPTICKIKSFFNVFTVCGSAFTLLIIAVDRFRKVCRPLEWQIKPNMALVLCFVQLTLAFVIALPVAFYWGTQTNTEFYKGYNITVTVCEKDERYRFTDYPLAYTILTQTITSSVMITMFALYIFVCQKLLSSKSSSAVGTSPAGKQHNKLQSETTLSGGVTSDDEFPTQSSGEVIQDIAYSDPETLRNGRFENNKKTLFMSLSMGALQNNLLTGTKTKMVKKNTGKKHARRIRRKTWIMFILTAVFIFTTVLYLTLLNLIANNVLLTLSNAEKAIYFFFFRLYFINHAINPVLYGVLDPHFRRVLKQLFKSLVPPCCS